jgi:hypothetical protein
MRDRELAVMGWSVVLSGAGGCALGTIAGQNGLGLPALVLGVLVGLLALTALITLRRG